MAPAPPSPLAPPRYRLAPAALSPGSALRFTPWAAPASHRCPEFEHIARFGEAEIVKDVRGRLRLRGGTPEDQAAARAWAAQFMSRPLSEPPRLKYTILPRPERPAAQQRPLPPTPPVRQPPTPEKQLRQYLINNHPALQTAHSQPDAPAPVA